MRKPFFLSAIITIISGLIIYGFTNKTRLSTNSDFSGENWGDYADFVKEIRQKSNGRYRNYENVLEFKVFGYPEKNMLAQDSMLFFKNNRQDFPEDWINDVNDRNPGAWSRIYSSKLTLKEIIEAQRLEQFISSYPDQWLDLNHFDYENVTIKIKTDDQDHSIMNKGGDLNQAQIKLLNNARVGDKYYVVINFKRTNYPEGEEEFHRLNLEVDVVPEEQAYFPDGYASLIEYFDKNSLKFYEGNSLDSVSLLRIKFDINHNGEAGNIELKMRSGYSQLDEHLLELIEKMPTWMPARNESGGKVSQSFELIYMRPGC